MTELDLSEMRRVSAEKPLTTRLRECANEVEEFPHPSHCDHLHIAFKLMREAADRLERAERIADTAMFELLHSEGYPIPCGFRLPPETAVGGSAAREAVEWLLQRGYVAKDADDAYGEFVRVLREPGGE